MLGTCCFYPNGPWCHSIISLVADISRVPRSSGWLLDGPDKKDGVRWSGRSGRIVLRCSSSFIMFICAPLVSRAVRSCRKSQLPTSLDHWLHRTAIVLNLLRRRIVARAKSGLRRPRHVRRHNGEDKYSFVIYIFLPGPAPNTFASLTSAAERETFSCTSTTLTPYTMSQVTYCQSVDQVYICLLRPMPKNTTQIRACPSTPSEPSPLSRGTIVMTRRLHSPQSVGSKKLIISLSS